jgi:hypothetical protein
MMMRGILTLNVLAFAVMFVLVGYTDHKDSRHLESAFTPIADVQEMCCCEYVVQDNLDPANRSAPRHAWIAVGACWAGYSDPRTQGRQARPPGRCVSAAQCGKKRL